MRKQALIVILLGAVALTAACAREIKPVIKPAALDIPERISSQQKLLDQAAAAREITPEGAQDFRKRLNGIQYRFDELQAKGGPTPPERASLNRELDRNSEEIFRARQAPRSVVPDAKK